jgi:hypothetical protein
VPLALPKQPGIRWSDRLNGATSAACARYPLGPSGDPLAINSQNNPNDWEKDVDASVAGFNDWFLQAGPMAISSARATVAAEVAVALQATDDLKALSPSVLRSQPAMLAVLRNATSPPLARDRLTGLAGVNKNLVKLMEEGRLPPRMDAGQLTTELTAICDQIAQLLDPDLFPWLVDGSEPDPHDREIAVMIVADRLTTSRATAILRNQHELRQLDALRIWLISKGYTEQAPSPGTDLRKMAPGTFCFRLNVPVNQGPKKVGMTVDAVIQPHQTFPDRLPLLVEAKASGDFTNPNKRRKEEATKIQQLRATYGDDTKLVLLLGGYFDESYLGYEASHGLDWIWEHRLDDLTKAGI